MAANCMRACSSEKQNTKSERDPLLHPSERASQNGQRAAKGRRLDVLRLLGSISICVSIFLLVCLFINKRIGSAKGGVSWEQCGAEEGFVCANVTGIPLDWRNLSDPRTITIAVAKYAATDRMKQGAVFINPGGPGGSGTKHVFTRGKALSEVLGGQFDIIGFDPRGVNLTRPYVSCFESAAEEQMFLFSHRDFRLELPVHRAKFADVEEDTVRQLKEVGALTDSLAQKCMQRTGDALKYMGSEYVVRDIDHLSRVLQGEARINFIGYSYGTVLGQYLVKILPPSRIGRVIIDGVVNPEVWANYPIYGLREGLDDIDHVFEGFAAACSNSSERCALGHMTPQQILDKVDNLIDFLYQNPQPVNNLSLPAVATASSIRNLLFQNAYRMSSWPDLADHLKNALHGNFTGIINATMPSVGKDGLQRDDSSSQAVRVITCSDTRQYDQGMPKPSPRNLTRFLFDSLDTYSNRVADQLLFLTYCPSWDTMLGSRPSRYEGDFSLEADTLETPILILTNTYDPVTSLASAKAANERLNNNARLVQQVDNAYGHCTLSAFSACTARKIRAFMRDGIVQSEKHALCSVDQIPFTDFKPPKDIYKNDDNLMNAYHQYISAEI